jgi:hypothetical protein
MKNHITQFDAKSGKVQKDKLERATHQAHQFCPSCAL